MKRHPRSASVWAGAPMPVISTASRCLDGTAAAHSRPGATPLSLPLERWRCRAGTLSVRRTKRQRAGTSPWQPSRQKRSGMTERKSRSGRPSTVTGDMVSCWLCSQPVSQRALFCHHCGTGAAAARARSFHAAGPASPFRRRLAVLERQFNGFRRTLAPERFAEKGPREKSNARRIWTSSACLRYAARPGTPRAVPAGHGTDDGGGERRADRSGIGGAGGGGG